MGIVIIGASGMLLQATEDILKAGEAVIVCSRSEYKYKHLIDNFNNIDFFNLDFSEVNDYNKLLDYIESRNYNIDTIIAWIHSPYYGLFENFLMKLRKEYIDIFLCRGSINKNIEESNERYQKLYYIDLGYNVKDNRWFNNEEISNAVLEAYYNKQNVQLGN